MNSITKKRVTILLECSIIIALFAGCGKTTSSNSAIGFNQNSLTTSIIINEYNQNVYLNEIALYSMDIMENSSIQPKSAESLSDDQAQTLKNEILSKVLSYKTEYHMALDNGYVLDEKDIEGINYCISTFKTKYDETICNKLCFTDSLIEKVYTEKAYALKYEQDVKKQIGTTYMASLSDAYSDTNFVDLYYVLFPYVESDEAGNPAKDKNGNYILKSDSEITSIKENADKYVQEIKDNNTDPEELADLYGVSDYSENKIGYIGSFNDKTNAIISHLSDGEISEPVEGKLGFIIIYMKNANDESAKELYLNKLTDDYINDTFPDKQKEWLTDPDYSSHIVENKDIWKSFDLKEFIEYLMD